MNFNQSIVTKELQRKMSDIFKILSDKSSLMILSNLTSENHSIEELYLSTHLRRDELESKLENLETSRLIYKSSSKKYSINDAYTLALVRTAGEKAKSDIFFEEQEEM